MYNPEVKALFLSQVFQNQAYGNHVFRVFEEYEGRFHKDICQFDEEELGLVLRENFGIKDSTVYNAVQFLKKYLRWCRHQGLSCSDAIDELKPDPLERIRASMYTSAYHLSVELNRVFDDVERQSIDVLYHAFFWLAFAGMEDRAIMELRRDQIDFEKNVATFQGVDYPIYQEGFRAVRFAATLSAFRVVHGSGKELWRDRIPSNLLIHGVRGKDNRQIRLTDVRSNISRKAGKANSNLSYRNVRMSGFFVRAYDAERAGITPTFQREAEILAQNKGTEWDHQRLVRTIRELKKDYQTWKQAFNY